MRLLIIGGTVFVGRALVAAARERGHEVTLFNRGVSAPGVGPGVTLIQGDRNGDLAALQRGSWDAVIDTCGYFPRQVSRLLAALEGRMGHYTFVSTVSVYADISRPGLAESAALSRLDDESTETVTPQTYGPLKAGCEKAIHAALPDEALIVRPGIIAGPDDPTDRFSYWVARLAEGGEVLAAGKPGALVQLIDVRDLAAWMITLVERKQTGMFNAVGPAAPLTMEQLFTRCAAALNPTVKFYWVDDAFLAAQGVPERTLPLHLPATETQRPKLFEINGAKALGAGLKLRPLARTAADTWQWLQRRPGGPAVKTGLTRERERELLAAWHSGSQNAGRHR